MKISINNATVDLSTHNADEVYMLLIGLVEDIEHYSNNHRTEDYDGAKDAFAEALEYILYSNK